MPEALVATVLISIGFLGALAAFRGIATTIFVSQTRQVATSLAREQLEVVLTDPYYRLRPWTSVSSFHPSGSTLFHYDANLAPVQPVRVGGVVYQRAAYIERLTRDADDSLVPMDIVNTYFSDTGIKRVVVSVAWQERGRQWTTVTVAGLKENPKRLRAEAKIKGRVVMDMAPFGLFNIGDVEVTLTTSRNTISARSANGSGAYELAVTPGTHTIRAIDRFAGLRAVSQKQTVFVDHRNSPLTVDFVLPMYQTNAAVYSNFWFNPHPVISRVTGSHLAPDGFDQEWVEIFNPTTFTWQAANLNLHYFLQHSSTTLDYPLHRIEVVHRDRGARTGVIPAGGYYLYANTGTIRLGLGMGGGEILADAIWSTATVGGVPHNEVFRAGVRGRFYPDGGFFDLLTTADVLPLPNQAPGFVYNGGGGALVLTLAEASPAYLDGVGWRGGLGSGACVTSPAYPVVQEPVDNNGPDRASGIMDKNSVGGLDCEGLGRDDQYARVASTAGWREPLDLGPAYDTDVNSRDWAKVEPANPAAGASFRRFMPRNSTCPAVTVAAGRTPYRPRPWGAHHTEAQFWINDGMSKMADMHNSLHWRESFSAETNLRCDSHSWGCRPGYTVAPVTRIATGTWTWGMFARRQTGSRDYVASKQGVINVARTGLESYDLGSHMVTGSTDTTYVFGRVQDVFGVIQPDVPIVFAHGGVVEDTHVSELNGALFRVRGSSGPYWSINVSANEGARAIAEYEPSGRSPPDFAYGGEGHSWVYGLHYRGYIMGVVKDDSSPPRPIPEVVVAAFNAADGMERSSGITGDDGRFRIYVATGSYLVRAIPEMEEVIVPESAAADMPFANMSVDAGTFTVTSAFGKRSGLVRENGRPIASGVVLVLTTSTFPSSVLSGAQPPPAVTAVFRAGNQRYAMSSSDAQGRFTFDIKKGTYSLYGFYTDFPQNSAAPRWRLRTIPRVFVNSGENPDFPNLEW